MANSKPFSYDCDCGCEPYLTKRDIKLAVKVFDYADIAHHESITWEVSEKYDIEKIASDIKTCNWSNFLFSWGIKFYLSTLEYFESKELFELCEEMKQKLLDLNEHIKSSHPTRYADIISH